MKKIGLLLCTISIVANAFTQNTNGWHLKDNAADGYMGMSVAKAYEFLKQKNLKSNLTIVAVIDSGIDTLHEDLKPILWTNTKEKQGNGIDDDKNGYVDDEHGWNFLGGKNNTAVKNDSYEGARVYYNWKSKYENADPKTVANKAEYAMWKRAKENVIGNEDDKDAAMNLIYMQRALTGLHSADSTLKIAINKVEYTGNELDAFIPADAQQKKAKAALLALMKSNNMLDKTNKEFMDGFDEYVAGELAKQDAKVNAPKNYRLDITGDDETNWNTRGFGNNDVFSVTPNHGTHVSGIIAAARNNGKGMDGVADNVQIMLCRAVPDGDEHDKDIALAIRYAVDNGAKIVNMSFGKSFSPYKKWVDDAVEYAQSKGVLLVHASGNDSKNLDNPNEYNFPTARLLNGKTATNWIEVGASGDPALKAKYGTKAGGEATESYAASFSNYGKKNVDIFSPGVKIYATIPGTTTYGNNQGTSMASPAAAGVCAILKSYFPKLTPEQIKNIVETTAVKPAYKTGKPGTDGDDLVNLSDISKTGGIINAYEAVKLAYTMSTNKLKKPTPVKKKK